MIVYVVREIQNISCQNQQYSIVGADHFLMKGGDYPCRPCVFTSFETRRSLWWLIDNQTGYFTFMGNPLWSLPDLHLSILAALFPNHRTQYYSPISEIISEHKIRSQGACKGFKITSTGPNRTSRWRVLLTAPAINYRQRGHKNQ